MDGRVLSFWDGIFSGAMLNFQGVYPFEAKLLPMLKTTSAPKLSMQRPRKPMAPEAQGTPEKASKDSSLHKPPNINETNKMGVKTS